MPSIVGSVVSGELLMLYQLHQYRDKKYFYWQWVDECHAKFRKSHAKALPFLQKRTWVAQSSRQWPTQIEKKLLYFSIVLRNATKNANFTFFNNIVCDIFALARFYSTNNFIGESWLSLCDLLRRSVIDGGAQINSRLVGGELLLDLRLHITKWRKMYYGLNQNKVMRSQ